MLVLLRCRLCYYCIRRVSIASEFKGFVMYSLSPSQCEVIVDSGFGLMI